MLVVNRGVIMRPIDADALNKKLQERVGSPESDELYEVNLCIIEAPTLGVVPVVHGRWLRQKMSAFVFKCSVCEFKFAGEVEIAKYCPNCGAKMDGR